MPLSLTYKLIFRLLPWFLVLCLMPLYPQQSLDSAILGISIWWEVLFPALFPFFVISELLLGLGLVHFIGGLFDPMMRPLFRIPGYGGFVMAMGFAAGYPVSARLTSQLWEQKLVNRDEAERLVAFTTSSDPIFLVGAVAVGFFHNPGLAIILALSHYGGSIIVGLLMRFHGHKSTKTPSPRPQQHGSLLTNAFVAMHQARINEGRSIGLMLQQAIQTSLKLVFVIGGLVIFVSVILEQLSLIGIMSSINSVFSLLLQLIHLPSSLSPAIVNGLFEVTLGSKAVGASISSIPLVHQTAIASFILSWGGLCVHAQITSILSHTNLRYTPFVVARLLHGIIAMILVYVLWKPAESLSVAWQLAIPVTNIHSFAPSFQFSFMITFAMILIPILIILLAYFIILVFRHIFSIRQ